MSMARFSPLPEIMPKPVIERMPDTSGILRSSSTARSETSRVRSREVPSGMSIAQKITLWSSSGRNEVSVSMKKRAVRRIVSASSTAARKMRLASHLAAVTKRPLKLSMHQLNHASGPCLNGRASWRRSEQRAGASVSAHTVEKHTAAESVTENCW